jgi:sialic acid synthase SpsE
MLLPDIIAEIGVNYYDIASKYSISLIDAAKMMLAEAKAAGASTVKFQIYKAEKLAAKNSPAYWDLKEEPTKSQRELFSKYDKLSNVEYRIISDYCEKIDIEFLATAFDVDNAIEINQFVKRHKIASADITNIELLSLIGSFGKPVLLSIGASTKEEIHSAVNILKRAGTQSITLLHCVLNYPTSVEKANLWKIGLLKSEFPDAVIGYSDHTKFNMDVLSAAWLLGAEIIEKHFTLDKNLKGNDHYHAASPDDLRTFKEHLKNLQIIIGQETPDWYDSSEEASRKFARRGVYLVRDVHGGKELKAEDVIFLRPQGDGITPMEWAARLSRQEKYSQDMKKGQLII